MNERIRELSAIAKNLATDESIHLSRVHNRTLSLDEEQEIFTKKFAELIVAEMHRKVIASILITDVLMEEKGQKPTSEDYIRALNKDFGVEE